MAGGQIAARHRQRSQIAAARELRRVVGGMIGRLRRNRARQSQRGKGECGNRPAIETNGKHHGSPSAPGFTARFYGSSRMRTQPAASSHMTMPRLAFNRKDTGGRIDWEERARGRELCLKTLSVWRYRDRRSQPVPPFLNRNAGPAPYSDGFSSREPASTSLKNATAGAGSRNRGHIAS